VAEGKEKIVRAALEAWNRRDWDETFRNAAPDLEIDNSTVQGEYRGVHRGLEEARLMFQQFLDPWESTRIDIEELVENGDSVFTQVRGNYQGRDGIEVQAVTGMCWNFRDGRIVQILMPNEIDVAREAAGLPLS
jgi:ketosteroid isomerase-like protein